jgi:hypothetical protein
LWWQGTHLPSDQTDIFHKSEHRNGSFTDSFPVPLNPSFISTAHYMSPTVDSFVHPFDAKKKYIYFVYPLLFSSEYLTLPVKFNVHSVLQNLQQAGSRDHWIPGFCPSSGLLRIIQCFGNLICFLPQVNRVGRHLLKSANGVGTFPPFDTWGRK